MSKRAAADLRWALMQATDCVRRYDPYFGDYYAKREGEDKKYHCLALAGVARKLMGVCLALMKEQVPLGAHGTINPNIFRRAASSLFYI